MMASGGRGSTLTRGSLCALAFLFGGALVGCVMEDAGQTPAVRTNGGASTNTGDAPSATGDAAANAPTDPTPAVPDATSDDAGSTDAAPPLPSDPDVVPQGSFAAGVKLLTIGEVNLRAGEGTTFDILTLVPSGKRVTVAKVSGASGWVNVTYDGKTGFCSKDYLHEAKLSSARGDKMADRALALWDGKPSRDLCLAGVDDTAESAGAMPPGVSWIPRKPSAVDWQNYVNANPKELLKRGYAREDLSVDAIPRGSIIGWRAGQCGYHAQYGHIEVVADSNSSRACSDYCGAIKKTCGAPFIYVPIEL